VFLASIGHGVIGSALGVLAHSPAVAIGLGVAYILPVEAIVVVPALTTLAWPGSVGSLG